jgi:hypothetical protein
MTLLVQLSHLGADHAEGFFTDPFPSNGRSIDASVRFRGNVFTESLPTNESNTSQYVNIP